MKEPVKKLSFYKKIILTFKLLAINPLISYCHYCGSMQLGKADCIIEKDTYTGLYWCRKCGATMTLVEKWKK